jgi:hypothetical protein
MLPDRSAPAGWEPTDGYGAARAGTLGNPRGRLGEGHCGAWHAAAPMSADLRPDRRGLARGPTSAGLAGCSLQRSTAGPGDHPSSRRDHAGRHCARLWGQSKRVGADRANSARTAELTGLPGFDVHHASHGLVWRCAGVRDVLGADAALHWGGIRVRERRRGNFESRPLQPHVALGPHLDPGCAAAPCVSRRYFGPARPPAQNPLGLHFGGGHPRACLSVDRV